MFEAKDLSLTEPAAQSFEDQDLRVIVTNHLFGHILNAWWVIALDRYQPGDIEGVLTDDIRTGFSGPFETYGQAAFAAKEWFFPDTNLDARF
jgi:hypothetical protein